MKKPARLLFLASGRGSCFEAVCTAIQSGKLEGCEAVGLICNVSGARVVKIAEKFSVPSVVLPKERFPGPGGKWDRKAYETELAEKIDAFAPDWICLAGYMLLLGGGIVRRWSGKIVNIHPSLLPEFKGLHAQRQALEHGATRTGCTVHLVTEKLDEGPIIEQASIEILPGDTEETLSARLLPLEHATYVKAIRKILSK